VPTYYETLRVDPSADSTSIQRACDALYDHWRRLVTHHELGDKAAKNLKALEMIRTTLLDARMRAIYDQSIRASSVGGLADPALLQGAAQLAPPPAATAPSSIAPRRPTANPWKCPGCGTENIERSKFCVACAAQLIRTCLACGNISSLVSTGICWECGGRHDELEARQRAEESMRAEAERAQAAQRPVLEEEYARLEADLEPRLNQEEDLLALQLRGLTIGGVDPQMAHEIEQDLHELHLEIEQIDNRMKVILAELGENDDDEDEDDDDDDDDELADGDDDDAP
jgi:hypothetical protein